MKSGTQLPGGYLSQLLQACMLVLFLAGCQSPGVAPAAHHEADVDRLLVLIEQRLDVAPMVARAKWNSGAPIDDPARERQILDGLMQTLDAGGKFDDAGKAFMRRFFQSQFDAGKILQHALHAQWRQQGLPPFAQVPDLKTDIRPLLDRLTPQMIAAVVPVYQAVRVDDALRDQIARRARQLIRGDAAGAVRNEAISVLLARP